MGKERKFDGVWDARRVLYNILFYADEEGYINMWQGMLNQHVELSDKDLMLR